MAKEYSSADLQQYRKGTLVNIPHFEQDQEDMLVRVRKVALDNVVMSMAMEDEEIFNKFIKGNGEIQFNDMSHTEAKVLFPLIDNVVRKALVEPTQDQMEADYGDSLTLIQKLSIFGCATGKQKEIEEKLREAQNGAIN